MSGLPRRIRPRAYPTGRGYYVHFRHPHLGKGVKQGLGTEDAAAAELICQKISLFASEPERWPRTQAAAEAAAEAGYPAAAVRIWFGFEPPARAVTPWEVQVEAWCAASAAARQFFKEYVPALEAKVQVLEPRVEELEDENRRLRRSANKHVSVTLRKAIERWAREYPEGRAKRTVSEALRAVRDFGAWIQLHGVGGHAPKGDVLLGEVRSGDLSAWIAGLKRQTKPGGADLPDLAPEPLSPVTKKKLLAYVSGFWAWAFERYELSENPVSRKARRVPGVARNPERIEAIRRREELDGLLEGLRPWPYWRAFVAFACLAGPRWGEQVALRVEDVNLGQRYARITATKTGRQRNVPIERSVLLPILREHLERRRAEREGQDFDAPLLADAGEALSNLERFRAEARKSGYLFPSAVGAPCSPRRLTPPGCWTSSSVFLKAWGRIARKAKASAAAKDPSSEAWSCWGFGPKQWRHCAGTALGHSGHSSLQIAQWLGNSEAMCRNHYIAPVGSESWGLKW